MSDDCPENHDDWRDYKANYCPYCGEKLWVDLEDL